MNQIHSIRPIQTALVGGCLLLALAGCNLPRQQPKTPDNYDRLIEMNNRSLELVEKLVAQQQGAVAAVPASAEPAPAHAVAAAQAPSVPVVGRLRSVGSDTMDRLMEFWKEGFGQTHPEIAIYHQGRGSSTAIPALIENKSEIGPMSRKLNPSFSFISVSRCFATTGYVEALQSR